MAQDEPAGVLYDFLYRDSSRISSYYAQIFGGRLSALEESDTEHQSEEKAAGVSAGVASGDIKHLKSTQIASRRTIDPHDVVTTDVLAHLAENDLLHHSPEEAPHNGLVLMSGTLVFVDRSMIELGALGMEMSIEEERRKPKAQRDNEIIQMGAILKPLLQKISWPSAFLLRQEDGTQVAGTIKEEGMEEPISSYYYKHGHAGLADVYLIGIKEQPSFSFTLPGEQLMGAAQQAAATLAGMMFPLDALRVTPVALFRKLGP